MQSGLQNTPNLTTVWQSRGPRLSPAAFESGLIDRTRGQPLAAVLVLPVSRHVGFDESGRPVDGADYAVCAPVAVARDGLEKLLAGGIVTPADFCTTMSEAAERARIMNAATQKTYLDDHDRQALKHVRAWTMAGCDPTGVFLASPAADMRRF